MNRYPTIWGGGQLLAFSGMDGTTDYESGLCLRTAFNGYAFELKRDHHTGEDPMIRYTGPEPETIELTGDFFRFYADGKVSSGVLVDSVHLLLEGAFEVDPHDLFEVARNGEKLLVAPKGHLRKEWLDAGLPEEIRKRAKFLDSAPLPEDVPESVRRTILKALSQLKTQIYSPEGQIRHFWSTPDRWPHKKIWLWDSVFHAIGMRHYNPALARDLVSAVFDLQQENGLIPLCGDPSRIHPLTQPPVLSLAMKLIHETDPAPGWIAALAPKLERYLKWIMANRDSDGAGLVEWAISASKDCRSGESGMDNSPRFDCALQLDAPDFNAFLAFECEQLATFLPEKRDSWLGHHHRLCKLMNERLWSEEHGLYVDYDVLNHRRTDILSSAGFLPLLCGAATPEQAARMARHLTDPETFGTPLRVPSIARSNTDAYRKDMWRGPVWVNINYLIALGLERYGYRTLARNIVQETLREEEKWYLECGTFFEFYDDRKEVHPRQLERKGMPPDGKYHPFHQVFHDYGWSATLYLEMIHRKEWR